ncbi:MAG TPA: TetR/AcrR family transcriptional regulator [Baekduia sp.]|nr:TetR/AcrR family transcriptional regulator [Baekduia sp.]
MSPRRSVADALETRRRIVERSVDVGTLEGLEILSFGRLADDLGMSKSGVLRHFDTKEALQLAAIEAATGAFAERMAARVRGSERGLERLLALCDGWIEDVIERQPAGGCFFTAVSTEFDGRPGPVRDAIAAALRTWQDALAAEVRRAVALGQLPESTDVAQVVFELGGLVMGLNQRLLLRGDRRAPTRARRAVRRILGVAAA